MNNCHISDVNLEDNGTPVATSGVTAVTVNSLSVNDAPEFLLVDSAGGLTYEEASVSSGNATTEQPPYINFGAVTLADDDLTSSSSNASGKSSSFNFILLRFLR